MVVAAAVVMVCVCVRARERVWGVCVCVRERECGEFVCVCVCARARRQLQTRFMFPCKFATTFKKSIKDAYGNVVRRVVQGTCTEKLKKGCGWWGPKKKDQERKKKEPADQ